MSQFLMPTGETQETTPQAQNSSFLMPPDDWGLPSDGKAKALSNLRTLSETNPDQAATDARFGHDLGMPSDMVSMDRQAAKQRLVEQAIHQIDAGPLQDWLGNPYNVSISTDDLKELGALGEALTPQKAWENFSSFGIRAFHEFNRTLNTIHNNFGSDFRYGTKSLALAEQAERVMRNPSLLPQLQAELAKMQPERETDGAIDWMLYKTASGGLPFLTGMTEQFLKGSAIGAGAVTAAGMIGPQTVAPPVAISAGSVILSSGMAGMTEWLYRQSTGNMYLQLLQSQDMEGNPLDPDVIRYAAMAGGLVDAGLQTAWGGILGKSLAPVKDLFVSSALKRAVTAPTTAGAFAAFGKEYAAHAGSGIALGTAATLNSTATERAAQNFSSSVTGVEPGNPEWLEELPGKIAHSAKDIMGSFGLIMLPGPLAKLRINLKAAENGLSNHALMSRAVDAAERSKVRQRDPGAFESYAQSALPEGMERQYVDAERLRTFFQDAVPEENRIPFTERLGIDEMEFAHALENGGAVSLDTAKFLSHLTPEQQRGLLPDLKKSPLDLSQRETATRDFMEEARTLVKAYEPDMDRAEEYAREKTRIIDEMVAAGRQREWAEADAEILLAYAVAREKNYSRESFDGVESLRRMEFARGEDGKALEQSNRGAVSFMEDGRAIVNVFQGNDASTVVHEAGHIFLRDMESMAALNNAPEALKRDWAIARAYLGLAEGETLTTEAHETFARSFEAYLREGQSPSFELARVFHNFRTWLVDLYKHVRNLGVELTPEIRGVFDRLLASDEQLAETTAMSRMAIDEGKRLAALRGERLDGLSAADMANLDRAYEDAHRAATNAMDRASLREFNKRRREALEEARSMVDADPVYMAAETIRKNPDKAFRGIRYDYIVENYSREAADDIRRKFPGVVNKEGGLGADVVCNDVGFESGNALVYALADAESRGKRISDLAERIIREQDEIAMPDQAVAASESYGRYLEKFQAALSKTIRKATYSPREYLRQAAKDYALALKVREATRYDTHQHTMRQQMQVRLEAARNGDTRAELFALEKLRLAHEMAGEAVHAREEVETAARRMQVVASSKSIRGEFKDAVLSLAERFEFGTAKKPRNPEHLPDMKTMLGELSDYGWSVSFPDWLVNGSFSKSYKDLTLYEFRQLDNLVRHLEKRGREEMKESRESFANRIATIADECAAPAGLLKGKSVKAEGSAARSMTNIIRPFFAFMDSLQFIFRSTDGYSNVGRKGTRGPNERLLWDKLTAASDAKSILGHEVRERIAPHLTVLAKSTREWERAYGKHLRIEGVTVPEAFRKIGKSWSADTVIGMALHMGTESNRTRLHTGYKDMTPGTRDTLLGLLSEKDWDAVQGIWDMYESLWERLDATHYRINGFHMQKVPVGEFIPVSLERKGIIKKLRGGYAPALYDPAMSRFMREAMEADSLFSSTEAVYQTPAAKSGMTKARSEKAPGLPLLLSADTIGKHLNDVVTYISMAESVREVDRVTRSGVYEQAVTHALGKDVYDAIRPNLKGMVRSEPIKGWNALAEKARSYATPFYLALNLQTFLRQFQSAPRALVEMEVKDLAGGVYQFIRGNPMETLRQVREMSTYMADRATTFDREIAQMTRKIDGKARTVEFMGREMAWEDVVNAGFLPIQAADTMITTPIWLGKFMAEMKKNGGEQLAAIRVADEAVRSSQPSFRPEDMSAFLRSGNGIYRVLSMFSTDTVGRYGQRQRYHFRAWQEGKISTGEYLRFNMLEALIPSLGFYMLRQLLWHGSPVPDADDEKGWKRFILDNVNDVFLQGVPLLGNFITGRSVYDSPVGEIVNKVRSAGGKAFSGTYAMLDDMSDEDAQAKVAMGLLEMVSILSKLPASQVVRKAMRGHKQYEDSDDATPFVYLIPAPKK